MASSQRRRPARFDLRAQQPEPGQPVHARHVEVEQQGIEACLGQELTPGPQRCSDLNLESVAAQVFTNHRGQPRIVIDQQQA